MLCICLFLVYLCLSSWWKCLLLITEPLACGGGAVGVCPDHTHMHVTETYDQTTKNLNITDGAKASPASGRGIPFCVSVFLYYLIVSLVFERIFPRLPEDFKIHQSALVWTLNLCAFSLQCCGRITKRSGRVWGGEWNPQLFCCHITTVTTVNIPSQYSYYPFLFRKLRNVLVHVQNIIWHVIHQQKITILIVFIKSLFISLQEWNWVGLTLSVFGLLIWW